MFFIPLCVPIFEKQTHCTLSKSFLSQKHSDNNFQLYRVKTKTLFLLALALTPLRFFREKILTSGTDKYTNMQVHTDTIYTI